MVTRTKVHVTWVEGDMHFSACHLFAWLTLVRVTCLHGWRRVRRPLGLVRCRVRQT